MLQGVFGNRILSPATFMDAREIPGTQGKVLCTLTAHNGPCRGAIGQIDPTQGANSQTAIKNLTPEVEIGQVDKGDGNFIRGPYLHPWPLDNQRYLVSKAGTIQLRDYQGQAAETLLRREEALGFYSPQPIRSREHEFLVSAQQESERPSGPWAVVMMQDVYHGLEPTVPRGTIKHLAVVQEVEKPLSISPDQRAFGFQFPVVSCGATYAPKKVWGYATVEADGSAHFRVPAQQPIYFLPLDDQGRAVQRMRTFTHLMPGESQSCVGCHADRNYSAPTAARAPSQRPAALLRPAEKLQVPEWGLQGFSYARAIQPVWDKHCVSCHGRKDPAAQPDLTGDKTDFFNVSYENLVRRGTPSQQWWIGGTGGAFAYSKYTSWIPTYNGQEANILEITPGRWGAKASLLARLIAEGHPDAQGDARVTLSDAEKRRVYAWLDLNCPYYGTSDSNYRELRGCRQQLPTDFTALMKDVGKRRCAACHEKAATEDNWVFNLPDSFFIRIDTPELNSFLRAPLARTAGGTEKCGQAVFANTQDHDYRRILQSFAGLQQRLRRRPRVDMVPETDFSGPDQVAAHR
jgi:mono/diheme cytochrome c family protein